MSGCNRRLSRIIDDTSRSGVIVFLVIWPMNRAAFVWVKMRIMVYNPGLSAVYVDRLRHSLLMNKGAEA